MPTTDPTRPDVAAAIDAARADAGKVFKLYNPGYWVAYEVTWGKESFVALFAQKKKKGGKQLRDAAFAELKKAALAGFKGDAKEASSALDKDLKVGSFVAGPYVRTETGVRFHYPDTQGTLAAQATKKSFKDELLPAAKKIPAVKSVKDIELDPNPPSTDDLVKAGQLEAREARDSGKKTSEAVNEAQRLAERRARFDAVARVYGQVQSDLKGALTAYADHPLVGPLLGDVREFLGEMLPNASKAIQEQDLVAAVRLREALASSLKSSKGQAVAMLSPHFDDLEASLGALD